MSTFTTVAAPSCAYGDKAPFATCNGKSTDDLAKTMDCCELSKECGLDPPHLEVFWLLFTWTYVAISSGRRFYRYWKRSELTTRRETFKMWKGLFNIFIIETIEIFISFGKTNNIQNLIVLVIFLKGGTLLFITNWCPLMSNFNQKFNFKEGTLFDCCQENKYWVMFKAFVLSWMTELYPAIGKSQSIGNLYYCDGITIHMASFTSCLLYCIDDLESIFYYFYPYSLSHSSPPNLDDRSNLIQN